MRVLARRGMAHPLSHERAGADHVGGVALVVPVHDDEDRLVRLRAHLTPARFEHQIVVVDDGSSPALATADVRLATRRGPAAARNAARPLLASAARAVVFLDADTEPTQVSIARLLSHLDDPSVGAVAPRVVAADRQGAIASYEKRYSPLDLGPDPALVGAGHRVSYVPTAALVCRRAALDDIGWFDEALRVGEDVDLVRRLGKAGWVVRYDPSVRVGHEPRKAVGAFLAQRLGYGSSAAALHARHPGTVAPLTLSGYELAFLGATAVGVLGTTRARLLAVTSSGAVGLYLAGRIYSHLRQLGVEPGEARAEAAGLAARSCLGALGGSLTAVRRVWWPLLLVPASAKRWRKPAFVLWAVSQMSRRPLPRSISSLALGCLDDVAYGAGVWWGCAQQKSLGALIPKLTALREL